MIISLRLHLKHATTMFLKNEELKEKDKQLVAIFDALTEGVMVVSEHEPTSN